MNHNHPRVRPCWLLALLAFGLPHPAAAQPPARHDPLGDPLPPHALHRLGTTRWRQQPNIFHLSLSADGKLLAAQSDDEGVVLRDTLTGQVRYRLPKAGPRHRPTFGLSADGRTVANFQYGPAVVLYDVDTGKERGRIPTPKKTDTVAALSADGKRVAVALSLAAGKGEAVKTVPGREYDLQVWDTVKGVELGRFPGVNGRAAFSPDGQTLIAATNETITVGDAATGKQVRQLPGGASSLALSADGRTLAALDGTTVRLCDVVTGKERRRFDTAQDKDRAGGTVALSADGGVVAFGGLGLLLAWDAATGKELYRLQEREGSYFTVAVAPDGKTLYWAVYYDPTVHRVALAIGRDLRAAPGHENDVVSLAFSPDGTTLLSHGYDSRALFWDVRDGVPARDGMGQRPPLPTGDAGLLWTGPALFSPDGKLLAMPLSGEAVCIREAATGKLLHRLGGIQRVGALAFSPDGTLLAGTDRTYEASSNGQFRLHLWEVATGKRVRLIVGGESYIRDLVFAPDGKSLVVGNGQRWDVASGKQLRGFDSPGSWVNNVVFTPDGATMIGGGPAGVVYWDVATGAVRRLQADSGCHVVAISRDGKLLATGDREHRVRLRDVASGAVVAELPGHHRDVTALAFSPDGKTLASGSRDTTILLWDVPAALAAHRQAAQKKPGPQDLDKHWADLGSGDAADGFKAIWGLVANPDHALPLLEKHLKPAAVKEDPDAEVKAGDGLRALRSVEVLERIGTPRARQLLQKLAGGTEARLTREARAALERLDRLEGAAKTTGQPLKKPNGGKP
jgi:WD40 repeat protein